MAIPEVFANLPEEKTVVASEAEFHGVTFRFIGFIDSQSKLLKVNLNQPQALELATHLQAQADLRHHPDEALILIDEEGPRLVGVHGQIGIGISNLLTPIFPRKDHDDDVYLHVLRTNPEDGDIFVEGRTDIHYFRDEGGLGLEGSCCLSSENREGGMITVTKDGHQLILKATQGRTL